MKKLLKYTLVATLFAGGYAHAATPSEIQRGYAPQARQENPQFKDFSASRGEQFYHAKRAHSGGKSMSCTSCHTDNPKSAGSHERTRKEIKPLAPVANAERIADLTKVEKWFKRNCNDVLERDCTAQEKGDFIAYLISVK